MEKFKGNKKRITAAVIAVLVSIMVIGGIAAAVRATTSATVAVVPVSDLNYGMYMDWSNSVSGVVTTEAEQNVYLSDTEKVKEVLVQEGQAVQKGDVLLIYDTKSTELSLEKEQIKHQKIELDIVVAKENIKILENTSPVSEDDGLSLVEDFVEVDPVEVLTKATVHEKILKADATPVSEGSEYEIMGTEDTPYVFLCKGESVIVSKDFIKKWQKKATDQSLTELYIELSVLDSAMKLQKAWIFNVMLLDPNYDIEVDLTTGKTAYAAMNDPVQMSVLLRKILLDVPEDERGAWLAALLDKLMILMEQEQQGQEQQEQQEGQEQQEQQEGQEQQERGALFAAMLNELGKEEQADFAAEFAAAASQLDEKTLSFLFKSLAENLKQEQVEKVDPEAMKEMLVLLLTYMTQEQVQAIDAQVLTDFFGKLSQEQIQQLDPIAISTVLSGLSAEQIEQLDPQALGVLFGGLSQEQLQGLDAESMRQFFARISKEQLEVLLEEREEDVRTLLEEMEKTPSETEGEEGSGAQGGSGSQEGSGAQEGNGSKGGSGEESSTGSSEAGSSGSEGSSSKSSSATSEESREGETQTQGGQEESENKSKEENGQNVTQTQEEKAAESGQGQSNSGSTEGSVPGTASATASGSRLLSSDASYTSDELAKAKREAKDMLKDLELSLRESDLKIEKAQKALEDGVVTANMNGVVKNAGDPDSPPTDGSAFIKVSASEGLYVLSAVKESMLGTVREGDLVTVTSWQSGGQYEAEIKSISPYPDSTGMFPSSGSDSYFPFTANIADKNAAVTVGEWVEVCYTPSVDNEEESSTLSLMKAFVREEGNQKYVYVRDENNKLKKQYIITGTITDSSYEVLDGLSESDWIAFPYGKSVKEGAKTRESTLSEIYGE